MNMDWIFALIVVGVVAGVFALKRMNFISQERATTLLKEGAVVVDVRNPGEFQAGNVKGALNIPLSALESEAAQRLPDKSRPVLVHCLSGGRSALAQRTLKKMGFQQVGNLGSYGRAAMIVDAAGRE